MFSQVLNEPYKLLTAMSVIVAFITLLRLYWLLAVRGMEIKPVTLSNESSESIRHPTFQKLEQTLSQQLIQAVLDKLHEVENINSDDMQRLSLSDERIMSYASLLVQLRKTETSTAEIHQMMSDGC